FRVTLVKEKKDFARRVNRLIAETHIDNLENKKTVDHIDRNIKNNNVDNLRWSSEKEQCKNKTKRKNTSGHTRKIWRVDKDTNEKWKKIPKKLINNVIGFKVSNLGRFKSDKNRITKGTVYPDGYLYVSIKGKLYSFHRLIAQTFLPNPENKDIVNHKDGNIVN